MNNLQKRQSLQQKPSIIAKIISLPVRHLQQAIGSLGELWRTPFTTVMTILVLGISLSLPATLQLFVKNANNVTEQWQSASEISLYLKLSVSNKSAEQLVERIKLNPDVASVTYISAKQALEDFRTSSGFGQALDYLSKNPLPATILVTPTERASQAHAAQALLDQLTEAREVEQGQLDLEWLTRLEAVAQLLENIVIAVAFLLCGSVVLIIGNTIRLAILHQRDAIAVMKLVGATDSFIQRPFLYAGMWYGVLGGLLACVVIALLAQYLSYAISALTEVYQQNFSLEMLSFNELLMIILFAVLMGLFGSYFSVKRHIKAIEPTTD